MSGFSPRNLLEEDDSARDRTCAEPPTLLLPDDDETADALLYDTEADRALERELCDERDEAPDPTCGRVRAFFESRPGIAVQVIFNVAFICLNAFLIYKSIEIGSGAVPLYLILLDALSVA